MSPLFERAAHAVRGPRARAPEPVDEAGDGAVGLVGFVLASALVGVLTGLAAATFRLLVARGAGLRDRLAQVADGTWWGLVVLLAVCAGAAALAAALVARVEPHAEGSGIPWVEAVVDGKAEPGRFRILPVKYLGGLLAIGSGLALGREGPSVQMGGTAATIVSAVTRRSRAELRILVAGGAAAGLATAFNAPIAGGVFVLEELVKRFDPKTTLATLVASASGFAAAHLVVSGSGPDFHVAELASPRLAEAPWVLVVGLLCGVLGVAYNRAVMFGLRLADANRWPAEARAGLVGVAVGVIVWTTPDLAGSGDNLTQKALLGHGTLWVLIGVFVLRFALGVASYAAGTPGGLFAPMLVLGSTIGLAVGVIATHSGLHTQSTPAALALIGMAAFFTATVHAPVTGLILAAELTGSTNQLPPMLGACAVAMLTAVALRSRPIYDLLTERAARRSEMPRSLPV